MDYSRNEIKDNFSLSFPFQKPDFSEYYLDSFLYSDTSKEDYSVDTSLYNYLNHDGDSTMYNESLQDLTNEGNIELKYGTNVRFEKYGDEVRNISQIPIGFEFDNDDASWVMACTFLIFTMHTGYGLIESGFCGRKNEVNILMRNALDVVLSGFIFWCFGYAIVFGDHESLSTPFFGVGNYFYDPDVNEKGSGENYLRLFYQLTFVSCATTIASAAMAERANMKAFMLYGILNVFVYSFPANWIWGKYGWLRQIGVIDLGGSGTVHELGGFSALVVATFIKPRIGINHGRGRVVLGNAKNSMMGLFMMWWAFLAFNSSTTFGVTGNLWMYAAKATVTTMLSSFGGGTLGISVCYIFFGAKINVSYVCNSVMGALVAITAGSFLVKAYEAIIIGFVSGSIVVFTMLILERTQIDDPRAGFAVHGLCGFWGLVSVGIFGRKQENLLEHDGLIHGEYYLIMVQFLAAVVIALWAILSTYILLTAIDQITPLRTPVVNELLGADYADHNILNSGAGVDKAVNILKEYHDISEGLQPSGNNLGHSMYLEDNYCDTFTKDQVLERTRLSLSSLFGARDITSQDVITYSKKIKSNRPPPKISEGGGIFGGGQFLFRSSDRSQLYHASPKSKHSA